MARSLTKVDEQGQLYKRPPSIEAIIDAANRQDLRTVIRRAAITNQRSPEFLPLECLTHLIREARRSGNESMNSLLPLLLSRCESILKRKMPTEEVGNWEEVRQEILGDFSVLFAEDGTNGKNTLDFYECRFYLAFRTFRIPYIEKEIALNKKRVFAPDEVEDQPEVTEDEFLSDLAARMRQPQLDLNSQLAIAKALHELPFNQCKAIILVYYYGLPIESDDASVTTASTVCSVTGRTIRNRLAQGLATLSTKFSNTGIKEEERGYDDDVQSAQNASR